MTMMHLAFWSAAAFIAYVYAGYPAALWMWTLLRSGRGRKPTIGSIAKAGWRPGVSIIIAARNEAPHLRGRIENLLQLAYPPSRRQIIVVSDGSSDDTKAVLAPYRDAIDLVSVPAGGKARALNAGVSRARGELLVFTDARQRFAADALAELTTPFADPAIGAVSGELVLDCESRWRRLGPVERRARARPGARERRHTFESTIGAGIGVYWRYEKAIRRLESGLGSTLGATGAIYAIRRSLWSPLPDGTILDDVLAPMRAVLGGFRVVFNPRARAFDRAAPDADAEAARKIRTLAGNYQLLCFEPRLLLPWRNPVWFQFISHKLARLLVPYALLAVLASSIALCREHPIYLAALIAQCAAYGLAGYGAWLEFQAKPLPPRTAAPADPGAPDEKEAVSA